MDCIPCVYRDSITSVKLDFGITGKCNYFWVSDFFINLFKLYFFFFYWGEVDLEVYVPNSSDANYHTTSTSKVPKEPSLKLAVMYQVSFKIKKITWFEIKRFIFRFLLYHLLSLWFWICHKFLNLKSLIWQMRIIQIPRITVQINENLWNYSLWIT